MNRPSSRGVFRRFWLFAGALAGLSILIWACASAPAAEFSVSTPSGRAPATFQFTDRSVGKPTTWQWRFDDGTTSTERSPSHQYTRAGSYQVTLEVGQRGNPVLRSKSMTVTVEAGPIARIEITPDSVRLRAGAQQAMGVRAFDAYGNEAPSVTPRWRVDPKAGAVDAQGIFTASTAAATYSQGIVAEVDGESGVSHVASATMIIGPGPLDKIVLAPSKAAMIAGESYPFTATAYDSYGNAIPAADLRLRFSSQTGAISTDGRLSANTAGQFLDAITVEAVQGEVTKKATASVTVLAGKPFRVQVSPAQASLSVLQSKQFSVAVYDRLGNETPASELQWRIDREAGFVTDTGLLWTSTKAGTYELTVSAGAPAEVATGKARVTVEPGALERVVLSPTHATVRAGTTQRFTSKAYDAYDNELPSMVFAWETRSEAGRIDEIGNFTAATRTGMHADAVMVTATEGYVTKVQRAAVTIEPGLPDLIQVSPSPVTIQTGQTTTLKAKTFDRYGNEIRDAKVTWAVSYGGGAVSDKGAFTAGERPGSFPNTIVMEAEFKGAKATATVSVTVVEHLPGRIVFDALVDGNREIFSVDPDGSNLTQLTHDKNFNQDPAWSPDGAKIIFSSLRDGDSELYVLDLATGTEKRLTNDPFLDGLADWSPSGEQIAFTSNRALGGYDLYIMDTEGEKVAKLTDNRRIDTDLGPLWSPDGKLIAYTSDEGEGADLEVWVMNADGSEKRQITANDARDVAVAWHPGGHKIMFLSDRDQKPRLALYIMDVDGSNVVRLTNSPFIDAGWASFSPDGTKIVFVNYSDGQLWVMRSDGQNPRAITRQVRGADNPNWQPISGTPVKEWPPGAPVLARVEDDGPGERFATGPVEHIAEESHYSNYSTVPPTFGPHWRQPAPWGIYTSPIPEERQVANLAHGGVILQYNTRDATLVTQLEDFVRKQKGSPCQLVLAPNDDMPYTIAITAWGARDTMDAFDSKRLQAFIDYYRGKGPEATACSS